MFQSAQKAGPACAGLSNDVEVRIRLRYIATLGELYFIKWIFIWHKFLFFRFIFRETFEKVKKYKTTTNIQNN